MKHPIRKLLCYCLLFYWLVTPQFIYAQTPAYVQLGDPTGVDNTTGFELLNKAADTLRELLQEDFKVFDFGFYLHNEAFEGGFPEAFDLAIAEASNASPYYLLFGKQSDVNGIYTRFWIDLKLPFVDSECYNQQFVIDFIDQAMNEEKLLSPEKYYLKELQIIQGVFKVAENIICCEQTSLNNGNANRNSSSLCGLDQSMVQAYKADMLSSPEFQAYVALIKALMEELKNSFQNCSTTEWKSFENRGIVPLCIWQDVTVSPLYQINPITDVVVLAGVIDGAYIGIKETEELLSSVDELIGGFNALWHAGVIYHLECENGTLSKRAKEAKAAADLAMIDNNFSLYFRESLIWLESEGVHTLVEELNNLIRWTENNTERCARSGKILATGKEFYYTIDSWDEIKAALGILHTKLDSFYEDISGESNESRYLRGRLIGQALIEAVGSGGSVNGGKILGRLTHILNNFDGALKRKISVAINKELLTTYLKKCVLLLDDKVLEAAFRADFQTNGVMLRKFLKDPNLVEAWKFSFEGALMRKKDKILADISTALQRGIKDVPAVVAHANHPNIITRTVEHIFRGHGTNGGRHHISALIADNTRKLTARLKETTEGFYEAVIRRADGTTSTKSFWPDTWDEYKIMDELKHVMANNPVNITGNTWEGFTSTGQKIHYYVKASDNSIISAFPIL